MFDFAANVELESLDTVPENFRVFYAASDNGFKLNSADPATSAAVATITGLNKSLGAARGDADKYKKQRVDLSPLAEYGEDLDAIVTTIKGRFDEYETKLASGKDAKLDLDKVRADLSKAHTTELAARDAKLEGLKEQLYQNLVTSEAVQAISANKGVPELLMPFVKQQVRVIEEEGKLVPYVVDAQGAQRFSGTTGGPMTVGELVAEMKGNAQFGRLFDSEAPSGPGSPPGQRRPAPRPASEMSSTEKIAAGLRKGQFARPGQE